MALTKTDYEYGWAREPPQVSLAQVSKSLYRGELRRIPRFMVRQVYADILFNWFKSLKIKSVLEVGCGQGVNLKLLSMKFQDYNYFGLEPTGSGIRSAKEFVSNVPLVQGNGFYLPFKDHSIDCVYTAFVLEQLAEIWPGLVREMKRVSKSYCLFLEPFKEAQTRWRHHYHLWRRGYFRQSYKDLEMAELKVSSFIPLITCHNPRFRVGLCVMRRG